MDKKPDKLDILMDWFLGDAKEINNSQNIMLEQQRDLFDKLSNLKETIHSTNDEKKILKLIFFVAFFCSLIGGTIGAIIVLLFFK